MITQLKGNDIIAIAEEKKIPTAQISRERKTGAMSCPRPEVKRKRRIICVLMSDTLHVRMARVRMTKLMSINLFF